MSEQRDEYRERVQAKLDRARRITPPTSEDNWDQGYIGGLSEVLAEYDRLAPEREREKRALAVFEEAQFAMQTLMAKGDGCVLCPLETECFEPEGVRCLVIDFVAAGRRLGILPEEAK